MGNNTFSFHAAVMYKASDHKNGSGKDKTLIQLQNKAVVLDLQLLKYLKVDWSSNTFS